ncbi:glycosyltransferase family 1 protein [Patescibacteria group bacterium]|nr:MAG: glycosyltransferase family 1 protein [Patescibacteria group bacterium]
MRICHIIPKLSYGGAERMLVDLINNSSPNFEHSVIVFFDYNPLAADLKEGTCVVVVPKKGKLSLGLVTDIRDALNGLKPDIVHTHLFGGDLWGRLAAKRLGLPVVTTEHNINVSEGWLKNELRHWLRKKSDAYVSCSDFVRGYMEKRCQIKGATVIKNGIELERFVHVEQRRIDRPIQLLVLGRLTKQKGHAVALRALAKLKNIEWRLSVLGEGELASGLRTEARELGIGDRVEFLPATREISGALAQHDILLMPSLWEGLGVAAMEAMAAGRLVVASRVGGLPELIKDGETGLLARPGDVNDWVEKLRWCFTHPDDCERLAASGREYARMNFGVDKMVREYEKVYLSLAN